MKINRPGRLPANSLTAKPALAPFGVALASLALAGCASQAVIPPAPLRPAPSAPAAPLGPPTSAPVADWRDLPQTPGTWRYQAQANGSAALFGPDAAAPLLTLRCDRARSQVVLLRAGAAAQPVPAAITTSSQQRALSAAPAGPDTLAMALPARDPMLDAMAFSRGRFVVEVNGLATLVVPAWAEVGRVIEDCR